MSSERYRRNDPISVGGGTISHYSSSRDRRLLNSPTQGPTSNADSRHATSQRFLSFLLTNSRFPSTLSSPSTATPPPPPPSPSTTTERYHSFPLLFPRQMNFMEVWWLSVPFAVVLCLILSWLTTGDDDVNIHESTIMRVSLRTFPLLIHSRL